MDRECVICHTPISGQKVKFCSNKCKQKDHYQRLSGQTNTYLSQTRRGLSRKVYLIDQRGGGCEVCGYNKNIGALEFHHKDPNGKDGGLDMRRLSNSTMEWIAEEFAKCEVRCSNCHREHHHPELDINNVRNTFGEIKVRFKDHTENLCLDCNKSIHKLHTRCRKCADKKRQLQPRPDKTVLQSEVDEHGLVWCANKYSITHTTVRRWLKP